MKSDFAIENLDLCRIGEIIRQKRKEQGLTQEELAERVYISPSTLSKIERGICGDHNNYIENICSELGINLDQLENINLENQRKNEKIRFLLDAIESIIDLANNGPDKALKQLKELNLLEKNDLYYPFALHLRGKCLMKKGKLDQALNCLLEANQLVKGQEELIKLNLKPSICNAIGIIYYRKSKIHQALTYINEGLNSFDFDGERLNLYYTLMVNKAVFLEKLGYDEEAIKIVSEVWNQKSKIEQTHSLLNLYELNCLLSKKQKKYNEAIKFAKEGIEIARINFAYNQAFELWTRLGSIYFELEKYEQAEMCYLTALTFKDKVSFQKLLMEPYTQLGLLYVHQQKWQEAEKFLFESISIGQKNKDDLRLIQALIALGKLLLKQGDPDGALNYLKQSLEIAEEYNFRNQKKEILLVLTQCYEEKQDMENAQKCLWAMYELEKKGSDDD